MKADLVTVEQAGNHIDDLETRVEELEREMEVGLNPSDQGAIIVYPKQIDAALNLKSGPALATLAIFKIVRCEGCGGSGRVLATYALSVETGVKDHKCPDCAKWGSHGWVKDES